jgi:hypothetical protein
MEKIVQWTDWDHEGREDCKLVQSEDGICLEGVVTGTRNSTYQAHYLVRTDASLHTREVVVEYTNGPKLHIISDGQGNWKDHATGKPLPSLQGCFDVDIGVTPATNTLPIKRLGLRKGQSQDITVCYVPLPSQIEGEFAAQRAEQRYTCVEQDRSYLYEGIFRNFRAVLEVDESGLVMDYPDTFRRMSTI